jgi:hypothetical protein
VPKRKARAVPQLLLDGLDRSKRLSGIRALIVAVLQDQTSRRVAADVVYGGIERLYAGTPGIELTATNSIS